MKEEHIKKLELENGKLRMGTHLNQSTLDEFHAVADKF